MKEFKNRSASFSLPRLIRKSGVLRYGFAFGVLFFLFFILILGIAVSFWWQNPEVGWLQTTNPQETAIIRYRESRKKAAGKPVQRRWQWVSLQQVSPYLIHSVVAAEDGEFFGHQGFNREFRWQALLYKVRITRGGSSIPQQLARNLFLEPSPNLGRKIREAFIAYQLEKNLTKERILELYLNTVEWGDGIYGAEAAARAYFNKPAAELSLSDAVRLAAIIPNPYRFSPLDGTDEYVKERFRIISSRLLKRGWISKHKYDLALEELYGFRSSKERELTIVVPPQPPSKILDPNYWISKLSDPDKVIMTDTEINYFNRRALLISGGIDIFGFPDSLSGREVIDKIVEASGLSSLATKYQTNNDSFIEPKTINVGHELLIRYDRNNNLLSKNFYYDLIYKLNLDKISDEVRIRYALVTERTDVFAWPIDELIMSKPYDYEFNAIEQSAIYLGTPVAVLHTSRDGKWFFIRTQYFHGWIKKEHLALTTREEANAYPGSPFLIITSRSKQTKSGVNLEMGTQIPLVKNYDNGFDINIPTKGNDGKLTFVKDFLSHEGVNEGFLPYTKRNALTQAFKLLGGPYSWGGEKTGWDCSLFVQDIFSTFGIKLPRNSGWQAKVGTDIASFKEGTPAKDKLYTIKHWEPGVTLLRLPGHIMLYLGQDKGKPYAIHAIWGVFNKQGHLIKLNRVAVTGLELGEGGERGSLLGRITDVEGVYSDHLYFRVLLEDFYHWLSSHLPRVKAGVGLVVALIWVFVFVIILVHLMKEIKKGKKKEI
ncbi:MAG TPA: transglycosylase domain-containing protein [Thermodesulfobacteriota bacterium]|nr:transglycosylase domain-containing protein [Thermodesulfobacteriota bacterium]